jgi:hypothetical protein
LRETQTSIDRVLIEGYAFEVLQKIPYRIVGRPDNRYAEIILHPGLFDRGISVADALRFIGDSISAVPLEILVNQPENETVATANLSRIVPRTQSIAPIQFDIKGAKLVIVHIPAESKQEDENNVSAARSDLLTRGDEIIDQLKQSNCDKRLLESLEDLQAKLASTTDIIQLGLAGIACGIMCGQFEPELPDAVCAMMKAQAVGVSMYAAQFPEWQRFTEQAAAVNMTEADIQHVAEATAKIIQGLRANPSLADPEIPRTLTALSELISDPKKATKRAAFAVWRTLENLLIKVFGYGADLLDQTAKKTIDKLSTAGSRAIVALVGVALTGAVAMSPVASSIPGSSWITQAVQVVKTQIENLGAQIR